MLDKSDEIFGGDKNFVRRKVLSDENLVRRKLMSDEKFCPKKKFQIKVRFFVFFTLNIIVQGRIESATFAAAAVVKIFYETYNSVTIAAFRQISFFSVFFSYKGTPGDETESPFLF